MLVLLCCFFCSLGLAESIPTTAPTNSEVSLYRGMWVLNGWAISNIVTGVPMSLRSEDSEQSAFYQMNAGWNIVNLGLASSALIRKKHVEYQKLSRIFFVNAGLDVGYVIGGMMLTQNGRAIQNPQQIGFGHSIILQGGFLLVFDAFMGWKMRQYIPENQDHDAATSRTNPENTLPSLLVSHR